MLRSFVRKFAIDSLPSVVLRIDTNEMRELNNGNAKSLVHAIVLYEKRNTACPCTYTHVSDFVW